MTAWKITYTRLKSYKLTTPKKGFMGNIKTSYIVIVEKDSTKALKKAQSECGFNDEQLCGMRMLSGYEIADLLKKHPELMSEFDFSGLTKYDSDALIEKIPELSAIIKVS